MKFQWADHPNKMKRDFRRWLELEKEHTEDLRVALLAVDGVAQVSQEDRYRLDVARSPFADWEIVEKAVEEALKNV